ncbi:tripartite ATP-independent transporter solute receptor, DctP family [Fodinibius roseus]|uniref:Tripartite ATP-independent transporter solute receptor, DctP family n=1 Tax=Fodinibius roseus TaxID=1194090 RepID=A0A1M5G750_9BACT|nr:TRAP transporter substrate-binding protein [Fodinibius roseus]SHF99504.1 tripartite ATP-independent transporter solute receptor, DctP family [Fodinibius roseus]
MKYRAFLLSVFITSLSVLAGCGEITDTRTIKLAHGLDVTHPVHKGMVRMAELVHKKSNNQLQIDIYPSQQLGSERETLELLQIGSVDMTKVSAAVLENFVPDIRVFSLPYLFRDTGHYYRTLDGTIGRELLLAGEEFWLRGLTYYDAGQRSFYTKERPIRTPEDLEGLKIRVQESPMAVNMVNTLGGSPTPISWGELYTALQQGIVDGAENNPPSFHSSRHYEVTNYFSLDQHSSIPDILLISTHLWDNLNEQEQQWIQEAADSSKVYQRKIWAEAEQEALEVVKEAGIEVIRPDKEPFREKVEVIYEEFEQNEPEFFDLIQSIRAVK